MRVHGTTGEAPIVRFQRDEAKALKPIVGMPPFHVARDLIRRVRADCAVEIDGNALLGTVAADREMVRATIMDGTVHIYYGSRQVAVHQACAGRRQRSVDPAHFDGLAGSRRSYPRPSDLPSSSPQLSPALLRSLGEYEALLGGGF
jgi:hypothetical protein